jgi:long-chain fatty acid transport protein
MRRQFLAPALLLALAWALPARAGGFDSPSVYTARHQAMGGTAIGYVDDPSALYHNPAGLSGVKGVGLLGDFSLLLAHIQSTPQQVSTAESITSQSIVAPFPMLAAGVRVHRWVTLGAAVFPVASGGASYEYRTPGSTNTMVNSTSLLFVEATVGASLNVPLDLLLPGKLSLGIGYRADLLIFKRKQGNADDPRVLNLDMSGWSFSGYRLGLQYRPIEAITFGASYRSKIGITAKADEVTVYTMPATDAEMGFVLPARAGFGARVDLDRWGLAIDLERAFQSQNRTEDLSGTLGSRSASVPNVYDWQDAWTFRAGAELRLGPEQQAPLRAGYIYDAQVTQRAYPTAFGTLPAPTQTVTFGSGYDPGPWQVNFAMSYRFGSTHVGESGLGTGCPFCSFAGDYALRSVSYYVDFSTDLGI